MYRKLHKHKAGKGKACPIILILITFNYYLLQHYIKMITHLLFKQYSLLTKKI